MSFFLSFFRYKIDGNTIRSPMTAVNMISAVNSPKWTIGTNRLNIVTPKPIDSISDEVKIALPLINVAAFIEMLIGNPCDALMLILR